MSDTVEQEKSEEQQPQEETTEGPESRKLMFVGRGLVGPVNIQVLIPEGAPRPSLCDSAILFPVLEKEGIEINGIEAKVDIEGLILILDEDTDIRWLTILGAGAPADMRHVDIFFNTLAAGSNASNKKYKDFAFHCKGVIADPADPEKGKGAWKCSFTRTSQDTAELLTAHIWLLEVFVRGSRARLLATYNTGANPLYTKWRRPGLSVDLEDIDLPKKAKADKLYKNAQRFVADIGGILQEALNARPAGRPPTVEIDPETIPLWSSCYDRFKDALDIELESRRESREHRWLSQYSPMEKGFLIKRIARDTPKDVVEALAKYDKPADLALEYTAWRCSRIPVNSYKPDRLRDHLQESDRLNGFFRDRNGRKHTLME